MRSIRCNDSTQIRESIIKETDHWASLFAFCLDFSQALLSVSLF